MENRGVDSMNRYERCIKCKSSNIIGVEYSGLSENHYDGISEWRCGDCSARVGRWTGRVLEDSEEEPIFGYKKEDKRDGG